MNQQSTGTQHRITSLMNKVNTAAGELTGLLKQSPQALDLNRFEEIIFQLTGKSTPQKIIDKLRK